MGKNHRVRGDPQAPAPIALWVAMAATPPLAHPKHTADQLPPLTHTETNKALDVLYSTVLHVAHCSFLFPHCF